MNSLRIIIGDQFSHSISCLNGCDKPTDVILMCEVWEEATHVRHHQKKIAFLFLAMRHFCKELQEQGYTVHYTHLDDADNANSFAGEVGRAVQNRPFDQIVVTHPGEHRVLQDLSGWEKAFGIPVELCPDDRFLCTPDAFSNWTEGRKQLRMEYFYREMRQKYEILMDGAKPVGGQWNYDAENRKPPKERLNIPATYQSQPDAKT